jgi:hypothetical protein
MVPFSHLGIGKSFGELALAVNKDFPNKNIPRAASVVCQRDSIFAVINKSDY